MAISPSEREPVGVALIAESTYPYLRGGVSAVMHDIIRSHPSVSFGIIHITWDRSVPTKPHYEVPDNVDWIVPVYLSMTEHREDFMSMNPRSLRMGARGREQLVADVAHALLSVCDNDFAPFWNLYDRYINPRTREVPIWPLLATRELMRLVEQVCPPDKSLAEVYWLLRELASQSYAVAGFDYPQAAVYHAHTSGYAAMAGAVAARQNGGGYVLTEHNLYVRDTINDLIGRSMALPVSRSDWITAEVSPEQRARMAWLTEMTTIAYAAADELTYLYPEALDEAAALGAPIARARVVPNGINLDLFAAARQRQLERDRLRQRQDHVWVLAYPARIVQIKGLLDLLGALAMLVEWGWTSFELRVMGHADESPDYLERCRQRAIELGLEDHIVYAGVQKLSEALGEVDIIVLPSHNEGQPLAILEAMTAGVPVVGTRVGGMEQLLVDPLLRNGQEVGPCGVIAPPHEPEEFADAILDLVSDPELYGTFRKNAFERVRHAFQLPDAMRAYGQLYAELVTARFETRGPGIESPRRELEDFAPASLAG